MFVGRKALQLQLYTKLQLVWNNSYVESLLQISALILAERAVSNAHRVGLTNLTFDERTLGDGN